MDTALLSNISWHQSSNILPIETNTICTNPGSMCPSWAAARSWVNYILNYVNDCMHPPLGINKVMRGTMFKVCSWGLNGLT